MPHCNYCGVPTARTRSADATVCDPCYNRIAVETLGRALMCCSRCEREETKRTNLGEGKHLCENCGRQIAREFATDLKQSRDQDPQQVPAKPKPPKRNPSHDWDWS